MTAGEVLAAAAAAGGRFHLEAPTSAFIRKHLAGRDLACWCPLDQPCHADVLLEIAHGGDLR